MSEDFFSHYIPYTCDTTEVPKWFARWSAIVGIGAILGRQYHFQFGHFNINPNIYCFLIGSPGTKKGTAIKILKKVMGAAGYETFASERTSKEKFLVDMSGEYEAGTKSVEALLDANLWGDADANKDDEMFIAIDEINDFIGVGNIEFISMLGNLWDHNGKYEHKIKTGKSICVNNPTISILGGNTPQGLSIAFPPEVIGQGFFSRLQLIYGEPSGKQVTFPEPPDPHATKELVEYFRRIKAECYGTAEVTGTAKKLLDKIYKAPRFTGDPRFEAYFNRRLSHLIKLCLVTSAARCSKTITETDVIKANTVLNLAEQLMPKALGQFGKAKNSDVAHKVIQILEASEGIVEIKGIWKAVSNDLEKMSDLNQILQNLLAADKIQIVPGGRGFLPKRKLVDQIDSSMIDTSYLTEEELRISK
jgi:hypothetical protein